VEGKKLRGAEEER